jgi:two-component system LytT family sensor kinase
VEATWRLAPHAQKSGSQKSWWQRLRPVGYGALIAVLASAMVATNLLFIPGPANPALFREQFLLELPVWFGYLAMCPLIFWLSDRYPLAAGQWRRHLLPLLVCLVPLLFLHCAAITLGRMPILPLDDDSFWKTVWQYVLGTFGVFLRNVSVLVATREAIRHYRRQEHLQVVVMRTRFEQLMGQLRPHFLFNALQGISALVDEEPARAQRMVTHLGSLLRSAMELDGETEVALRDELAWLAEYVELQQMRYPNRLSVHVEIAPEARSALVPRFLLQPILENCIVHVLEGRPSGVCVCVKAERVRDSLEITVLDDGPGFPATQERGLGLRNLIARLKALYEDRAEVRLENAEPNGARVLVWVPFELAVDRRKK